MIPLDDWMPQAKRKLAGGRRSARGDHSCGDPGSLQMSKEGSEWRAYCHRCGESGYYREHETPEERMQRVAKASDAERRFRESAELPAASSRLACEWPDKDKLWFYKMGIGQSRVDDLGLYWNEEMKRVVLPIKEDGRVVFWMARSQLVMPKWMGPVIPKKGLAAKYGVGRGDEIVVLEDPLSAYKIGLVNEAWSLLGTKLSARVANQLVQSGKPVVVWLDDDKGRRNGSNPGQEAAAKIITELAAYGVPVRNVKSDRDPKYYSQYQLKEMLNVQQAVHQ